MKKIPALIAVLFLLPLSQLHAADTKVTDLTADTAPTGDDLLLTVDDVSGTPTSKKATISNLFVNLPARAATALTAGAAVTLTVQAGDTLFTDTITTDNQDQTITFSGAGVAGARATILFITDTGGSGDEVITFHTTLVNSAGTLTLANLTAGRYVVTFQSDGSVWNEVSRTTALS